MNSFHLKSFYALLVAIAIGVATSSIAVTLILAGIVIAVAAEIDISLQRRGHDRRQGERRGRA